MYGLSSINFKQWIDSHRHLLRPPVMNQVVYKDAGFIIMVVGGPNARKDYHYNEGEKFFYQLEGEMNLRIIHEGKPTEIPIRAGEIFLLPARVPHSPQRSAESVGLVIERRRAPEEKDGFLWFCESCNTKLHEEFFHLTNIVEQLPPVMNRFYSSVSNRTCQSCGAIMEPPAARA